MRLSSKDRNKLIILGVMIVLFALIAVFFNVTRFIPLRWIGIACLAIEFLVLIPVITVRYFKLYGKKAPWTAYVPVLNSIISFPNVPAIILSVFTILAILCAIAAFIPVTVYANLFGQSAMEYPSILMSVLNAMYYFFFFALGIGYCCILHDVRDMSMDSSGEKMPLLEFVYYPLQFLPVINLLGLVSILNYINRLNLRHYSAIEIEKDTDLVEE